MKEFASLSRSKPSIWLQASEQASKLVGKRVAVRVSKAS